jgi:hypothetical protein
MSTTLARYQSTSTKHPLSLRLYASTVSAEGSESCSEALASPLVLLEAGPWMPVKPWHESRRSTYTRYLDSAHLFEKQQHAGVTGITSCYNAH